jgi:hypothetical protein
MDRPIIADEAGEAAGPVWDSARGADGKRSGPPRA